MKNWFKYTFIGIVLVSLSCTKEDNFKFYTNYDTTYLNGTKSIPEDLKPLITGIFQSESNPTGLGSRFVLKWHKNKLSIFSNHNGIYAVLDGGIDYSDSSIKLAGFWRSPIVTDDGSIYLTISKENGGSDILQKKYTVSKLSGKQVMNDGKSTSIELLFERFFSSKVLSKLDFAIIAHRGGGRNSDNIPYAENSLELVKHATEMGANAVEIDVKLTKDNVPIVYHDDDINIRLTQKSPIIGNVENYDYGFLKRYVKLVDGQTIPTLEEMLNTIIDSTDIKFVWLDNKGGTERFFNYTLPVMYKAVQRVKGGSKSLFILNGLPTEEVASEFAKITTHKDRPSLCELSFARAKELQSIVYAPRWTLGTLDEEVAEAHSLGMKAVTWTIDINTVMRKYLGVANFDGILTNYPSILAYEFYTQE